MKKLTLLIGVALALVIFAAACSHSSDSSSSDGLAGSSSDPGLLDPPIDTPSGTQFSDDCPASTRETLEATEIGISGDEITILVMADIGSPAAPGLFQGSIDGTRAWVDYINANGGLACRTVKLLEADSMINPVETTNAYLEACEKALSAVGSTSLFVANTEPLNTCDDKAGNPTGLPDFPERAIEAGHACSPNVFSSGGIGTSCPHTAGVPQIYTSNVGFAQWINDQFAEEAGGLHGIFLIPSDTPSAIIGSMPAVRSLNRNVGIKNDGEFGVGGRDAQATFGEYLTALSEGNSNYARTGSNDQSLLKWRREAEAQGGLDDIIWTCSLACYTKEIAEAGETSEGTYFWLSFLPFEEREFNTELDTFLTAIGNEPGDDNPASWAAGAWASSRLFEQVINSVVDEYGLNGITRARILATAAQVESFTANEWFGEIDFTKERTVSKCFVAMQVQNGEFVRQFPAEKGTLDCNDDNLSDVTIDSSAEFENPSELDTP